ncbi:DUF6351 family protein [Promicromonospora umidemergens]|uniref:DUF6351 family protein n=1 Tax=Promicromonospora umidemergens TaxID=629679 RepID=A0ABP8XYD0_9MICO|nr:DUF6351 family protein [Promicromonospora umidemergens]
MAVTALVVPLAVVTSAAAEEDGTSGGDTGGLRIVTVSSRPDAVSGTETLARVTVPAGVEPVEVTVTRDGVDVTESFRADGNGLLGLVDGLDPGRHRLVARAAGTAASAERIDVHPATGPVFSGPQQEPFFCETAEYRSPAGTPGGAPVDEDCSLTTRVEYLYRTTGGKFAALPDPARHPADLATTTTLDGAEVPYIVRVEIGTANRGIYEIASLHDPAGEAEPTAHQRSAGWNGRLVYTLGGGCRGGWYQQGSVTGGVLVDPMLSRGFAVASNTLNAFGNNCSDLLTTESLALTKEVFVEAYGEPDHTMGWGCSGGAYQAHQAADSYPGLLDGIIVGCGFPDVGFGTSQKLADARLLHTWFTGDEPGADTFTPQQQLAVSGFGVHQSIAAQSDGAKRLDPDAEFDGSVPLELRYDAETNPTGARATVWDHTRNAYGIDRGTGFALRPLDNGGVQYGLDALRDGAISVDQFLDLNEGIGGFDIDAEPTAERIRADPAARRAAYRTGRMLDGGGGLARTPIIDFRAYTDDLAGGDIHMRYHSFSTRDRLIEANGDADNQVMLVQDNTYGGFDPANPVLVQALEQMDRWLRAVRADESGRDPHDVVVDSKPADLVDACWTPGAIGSPEELESKKVVEDIRPDAGRCDDLYPTFTSPRIVAGGPLASDVITCRRTAPDQADYPATSTRQWHRLRQVFRDGVCDYGRPGVDEVPMGGTWAFFSAPGRWDFAGE